jgi:hypothetical protein
MLALDFKKLKRQIKFRKINLNTINFNLPCWVDSAMKAKMPRNSKTKRVAELLIFL